MTEQAHMSARNIELVFSPAFLTTGVEGVTVGRAVRVRKVADFQEFVRYVVNHPNDTFWLYDVATVVTQEGVGMKVRYASTENDDDAS